MSATSTAQHRLLVFRVCDAELCSSQSYLQWFHDWPPEAIHTAPVPELGQGRVVTSAHWVRTRAQATLVVVLDPRAEGLDPLTLFLVPGEPGRYRIYH